MFLSDYTLNRYRSDEDKRTFFYLFVFESGLNLFLKETLLSDINQINLVNARFLHNHKLFLV